MDTCTVVISIEDECWQGDFCQCGYRVSIIFPDVMSRNVAVYNLTHAWRNWYYSISDIRFLLRKIYLDTAKKKWKIVWKSWGVFFAVVFLTAEYGIDGVAGLCVGVSIGVFFATLSYFYANVTQAAEFINNN